MDVVAVALPFVATGVGAAITYVVNVRQRKRTYVDDLINAAIAAVTAAEVSVDFLSSVAQPTGMSETDYAELERWLKMEGMKAWATAVRDANLALARVIPYRPAIKPLLPFSPDATHRGTHQPIVDALSNPDR